MVEKIKTGIPGLDEMVDGGLPKGSTTVISGPPGIGKSNLAMQYIYNGISQCNEPGVYITIEDTVEDVENYAAGFGWNIREYEDAGRIAILGREIFEGTDMDLGMDFGIMRDVIKETKATRIVLDSVTLFNYLFKEETSRRIHMLRFLELMRKNKCTTLMTAELPESFPKIKYEAEHFLADGLIILFWSRYRANNERCLWVVKIRGTKIVSDIRPLRITSEGVSISPKEVPFTLLKQEDTGGSI